MAARKAAAPAGLKLSGKRLWSEVTTEFRLSEHERIQLEQACETADLIDRLRAKVRKEGDLIDSPQGLRTHPAVIELRQQRIVLARLLAALKRCTPGGVSENGPCRQIDRGPPSPRGITCRLAAARAVASLALRVNVSPTTATTTEPASGTAPRVRPPFLDDLLAVFAG